MWQDPPRGRGGRSLNYGALIEALQSNPGRWALIANDWRTSAGPAAFRQNGCEVTTRRNKDDKDGEKTWSVYARYPIKTLPPSPEKARVDAAVATGTALKPAPAPAPRRGSVAPANDMGLSKFLADRRARGAVDVPE